MPASGRRSARSRIRSSTDDDDDRPPRTQKPKFPKERAGNKSLLRIFDVNLKVLLGFGIVAFGTVFVLIHLLMKPVDEAQRPRVVTPFPAPKVMDLPQFQGEHKESLYWGTYRPHVYLGIRARTPRSLVAGLMWLGVKDGRYFLRHVCQDADGLSTYGWTRHNGRDYGHQKLVDQDMNLMTSFLKSKEEGSGYGGDWAVRIDVQSDNPRLEGVLQTAHLFFYIADEGGNHLSLSGDVLDIQDNSLLAFGSRGDVGNWNLHLKSKDHLEVHYSGFRSHHIHNLSDLVEQTLGNQARNFGRLQLSDSIDDSSNIMIFQISGKMPFSTDIAFLSGDTKDSNLEDRLNSLTGTSLTTRLHEKEKEFDEKFKTCFNLTDELDSLSVSTGKAALGNLLGGIGYFYGQSKISLPMNSDTKSDVNYISYWPAELYTAVPSRPFFPRGFLWDEGFHQLLIWRWDVHICLDILGHWLDLMNVDGWIPREQILGEEALSKVPQEFVPQHPTNGNPPTLFLVLKDLLSGMERNIFTPTERNHIASFLERALIRLEAWFQWFNTTQSGKDPGSFFWHGRDNTTTQELNPKSLSSGLDDYPRASHPNEEERHLDLRCWMLLAADCLFSISKLLKKENESGKEYGSTAKLLADFEILNQPVHSPFNEHVFQLSIYDELTSNPTTETILTAVVPVNSLCISSPCYMHFDHEYGTYLDYGNHTEKVRLTWQDINGNNGYGRRELVREVLEPPKLRFVPHIGYVSLFPFMRRIIPPESVILDQQLNLISNRSILWTDYGLRSLSKTSSIYMKHNTEHDGPYWRGPIWMNMNYMVLSSLHYYSKENGPYRDKAKTIYNDLRNNLIRNIVRNYKETGYVWEQYDQKKGKGKGTRLFTGWTSLVVLIMGEAYSG